MFESIIKASQGKQIVMFLDYDGTLSPIVDDPDRAFLSDAVIPTKLFSSDIYIYRMLVTHHDCCILMALNTEPCNQIKSNCYTLQVTAIRK